jgi:hypothetical protein
MSDTIKSPLIYTYGSVRVSVCVCARARGRTVVRKEQQLLLEDSTGTTNNVTERGACADRPHR